MSVIGLYEMEEQALNYFIMPYVPKDLEEF
jgi:hypothetical protein